MKPVTRDQSGFSLATVIALGVVASLWMLATASLVVPARAKLTVERTNDMARASAEAGLDWALNQFNTSISSSTQEQTMLATTSMTIPTNIMADYNSSTGKSNFTGTISVTNAVPPYTGNNPPATYTTYLYNQLLDNTNQASVLSGSTNYWRVLTATVTNGIVSQAVRVILQPTTNTTTAQTQVLVNGTPQPIFNFSAFGIGSIGGNGNSTVNSYDSAVNGNPSSNISLFNTKNGFQNLAYALGSNASNAAMDLATPGYGDYGTNGYANLVGNGAIGGNLEVFGSGSTTSNYASASSNVTVEGAVQAVDQSGFTGSQAVTTSSSPQTVPPAPSAPANPTPLPGGGSTISLKGKSTMTLTAGNYVVNSISISGNGQLNIDNSAGPVNIWVQGTGSSVDIEGNGILNASTSAPNIASNLSIWYGGSSTVKVAGGGTFTGTVYAPNAEVDIAGGGDYYGAAIGNSIQMKGNGAFHYDRALMRATKLFWTPQVLTTETTSSPYVEGWQAVSWHEFNPNSPY